ncbi:cell division control protein 42 homolog [Paramacrobiotus metropolitanus]|uniref:cell division control protein 42 homolog n=1 Tax=Paramacrobiotus metropolitanus TaxID=2943436 RepID=UPI0024457DBC|nr:cell division control protein 42 homolog [Paramacrobiotus metropolitanus]
MSMFPPLTLTMPESPHYHPRNNHNEFNGYALPSTGGGHFAMGLGETGGKMNMSHLPDVESPTSCEMPTRIKLVFVGDGSVGKTSLLVSYTTNGYPTEYIPTAFDKYSVSVNVDNQPIRVQLFDTAGQDDFDSLRPLCYPDTDVFLLCFSIVNPTSFRNIRSKWLPEIQRYWGPARSSPLILVGTQCDLRNDVSVLLELARYNEHPVTDAEARDLAHSISADCYIESSALTQWNLKKVFDTAILAALNKTIRPEKDAESNTVTCTQLLKRTASRTKEGGKKIIPRRSWKKYCCIF